MIEFVEDFVIYYLLSRILFGKARAKRFCMETQTGSKVL